MKRIEKTSPLYLKRLVRELNSVGILNGFYADVEGFDGGTRCNRARLRYGVLEVREIGEDNWLRPVSNEFVDVQGQKIAASTVV